MLTRPMRRRSEPLRWRAAPGARRAVDRACSRARTAALTVLAVVIIMSGLGTEIPPAAAELQRSAPAVPARSAPRAGADGFVPVTPARALDTRISPDGPLGPGVTRRVSLAALAPPGATAVVLTITATEPTVATHLTIWPAGGAMPPTSNLNVTAGETRANTAVIGLGSGTAVDIANAAGRTQVIVDVTGWFVGDFSGIAPWRALDTRLDGRPLGNGGVADVVVAGRGGIPADAVAVAVNITATNPEASTYLTLWPAGSARPTTSSLNTTPGRTVATFALVGVGRSGAISIANFSGRTDVIIDVFGWFASSSGVVPSTTPTRAFDSRIGSCGTRLAPGETRTLRVTDRADVAAVAFTLTAVDPGAGSYVTVWPTGRPRPETSNLNLIAGQAPTANFVIAAVGEAGQIDVFNFAGGVDLVIDIVAVFGGVTPAGTPAVCPSARPPDSGGHGSPGPHRLVVRPELHRAVGTDRIAVWVCDVPDDTVHPSYVRLGRARTSIDAAAAAAFANERVAPYFAAASAGRYRTVFEAVGRIALTPDDGPLDCLERAEDRTDAPFTNTLAIDTSTALGGLGGPRLVWDTPSQRGPLDSGPPSSTYRGAYVGGAAVGPFPSQSLIAHEIGHTLHWGHSHISVTDEYDNPVDLMSGQPRGARCLIGVISFTCRIQHTIAFNRYAAGWIDDAAVALHRTGRSTVLLSAPERSGTQMLVAVDPDTPDVVLTAEARPRLGYDEILDAEGVALHVVDQRRSACTGFGFLDHCISTERRQRQALGSPDSFDHVIPVGGQANVFGLTIDVLRRTGDGFEISVSGSFDAPAVVRQRASSPAAQHAGPAAEALLPAGPYWPAP